MSDQDLVAQYLAKGGQVTQVEAGVSVGLAKTDYLPRKRSGFANRPAAPKLETGDAKFDMYANALPSELRAWAAATGQDVRALYKEYRALKKDGLLEKHMPAVKAWERGNENGEHLS